MPALFRQSRPYPLPTDAEIVDKAGKPHARIRDGKRYELYPLTADGKKFLKPSPVWCAMVRGADGRRKPVRLSRDKAAAAVMLAKLLKEIEDTKAGIRTPTTAHQSRPLSQLLTEYCQYARDREVSERQIVQAVARCSRVFSGCGFVTLADLDSAQADRWLAEQRRTRPRFGAQTSNHHVASLKAFGNWLVRTRKASTNPLGDLSKVNVETDIRHQRRPLTAKEFVRLIAAAQCGQPIRGLVGPDRVMLYTVAAYTGLRASELASLTSGSFHLDATPPTLTVEAGYSKHRRKDTVPVHLELVGQLRPWLADKKAGCQLWPGKHWSLHKFLVVVLCPV